MDKGLPWGYFIQSFQGSYQTTGNPKGEHEMTATATTTEPKAKNAEQELRSKIAGLDRKIEAQRKHIESLTTELGKKKTERAELVRQRIELLRQELPDGEV